MFKQTLIATGLALAASLALAQASGPAASRPMQRCADVPAGASAPAGCGPRAGMGPGMGGGMGAGPRGMGPRSGPNMTPGWPMMTPEERSQHHDRMAAAGTYEACRAELERHREAMAERARGQGKPAPGKPRRDACAGLKPAKG
jgi:hypothetical protein